MPLTFYSLSIKDCPFEIGIGATLVGIRGKGKFVVIVVTEYLQD